MAMDFESQEVKALLICAKLSGLKMLCIQEYAKEGQYYSSTFEFIICYGQGWANGNQRANCGSSRISCGSWLLKI